MRRSNESTVLTISRCQRYRLERGSRPSKEVRRTGIRQKRFQYISGYLLLLSPYTLASSHICEFSNSGLLGECIYTHAFNTFPLDLLAFGGDPIAGLVMTSNHPINPVLFLFYVFIDAAGYLPIHGVRFVGI